jgi:1-acyl-sn-glycerol-3-phosphate acyltransferase
VKKLIARSILKSTGWRFEGEIISDPKYILIAAPHTTNWDLMYMLAVAFEYDIHISWMGKAELFRGVAGPIMRGLGGVPVKRDKARNLVQQMVDEFEKRDQMVLAVPPEGTRSYREHWKSGFYHIARMAGVRIVPGFLDYSRKIAGFGPALTPTDDIAADMDILRDFYADKAAKFPEKFCPPRLKDEGPLLAERS